MAVADEAQDLSCPEKESSSQSIENNTPIQQQYVGFWTTVLNLLNSLIGAGILTLASAFSYCGLFPSIIIMAVIALLADIGAELAIKLKVEVGKDGLDSTVFKIFGKKGQVVLSVFALIFLYSGLIGFLTIGSTFATSWLKLAFKSYPAVTDNIENYWPRALLVFVYWALIPGVMTIPRRLKVLSYSSYVNIICIVFFLITMIYESIRYLPKSSDYQFEFPSGEGNIRSGVSYGKFGIGIFQAISLYGLTFSVPVCIIPMLSAYPGEVKDHIKVSRVGTSLCCLIVMIPAILGYLMFGENVQGIVLDTFPDNDPVIIVCRVCFMLVVTGSYVMIAQPVMGSWAQLIFGAECKYDPAELPPKRRWLVLALTNIPSVLASMVYPDATNILSVGGGLGGNIIDFCFPPAMWIKQHGKPLKSTENILCILFIVFGAVSGIISTVLSLIDLINSFHPSDKQIKV